VEKGAESCREAGIKRKQFVPIFVFAFIEKNHRPPARRQLLDFYAGRDIVCVTEMNVLYKRAVPWRG